MNNVFFESSKSYKPDSLDLKQIKINDYDELQKLATSYKGDNWALCLACLFKAKPFLYTKASAPLLQQMTRLPIFLQQAGLFEESKHELQELFDNVDSHIEKCAESIGKNKELYKKTPFRTFFLIFSGYFSPNISNCRRAISSFVTRFTIW